MILALTTVFASVTCTFAAAPDAGTSDEIPEEVPEITVAEEVVAIARAQAGYYDSNINKFTSWYYGYDTDA